MNTVTSISVVLSFSSNKLQVAGSKTENIVKTINASDAGQDVFADTVNEVLSDVVHSNICYFTIKYCNIYKVF